MTKIILTFLTLATLSACTISGESARYDDCEDPTKLDYSKSKYMQQQSQGKCQHIHKGSK